MQTLQWRGQALGARVLRAWLGVTFTYAGVQKLADPGFFTKGSRTYIGDQLAGFAHSSPLAPVLDLLGHAPVLAGAGVALTEIAIGVATLAGVAPSTAALGGVLLSVSLWLSASWHVHPYFLGSDSIYAVAWLAYAWVYISIDRCARSGRRLEYIRSNPTTSSSRNIWDIEVTLVNLLR